MKLKQYIRYQIDFRSKWMPCAAILMGLSFFLRVVYYFCFVNIVDCSAGILILHVILPLLLCAVYLVFIRIIRLNSPGIFAILGTVFCLMFIIWSFSSGNIFRILLSVVFYLLCSVVLLGTAGGYLPEKLPIGLIFIGLSVFRYWLYAPAVSKIGPWLLDLSAVLILLSYFCLTRGFKEVKMRPQLKSEE